MQAPALFRGTAGQQLHTLADRYRAPGTSVHSRIAGPAAPGVRTRKLRKAGWAVRVAEPLVRELQGEVAVPNTDGHEPKQNSRVEGSTTTRIAHGQEVDTFDWTAHWYPIGLIDNFRTDTPNPATLLGKEMVVWRDGGGQWCAAKDECPHRFARLSDGRMDNGNLECRYHGWQFNTEGKCVHNPQADGPKAEATICASSRSCLQNYPTRVEQGLLWVWPQPGAWLESLKEPPPLFEEGPEWFGMRTFGLMHNPVSYAVMVENSLDPDHAPFLHDGSVSKKADAAPMHMQPEGEISTNSGFTVAHDGYTNSQKQDGMKATRTFIPPCTVRTDYEYEDGRGQRAVLYFVPEAPYKTRVYANFTFRGASKGGRPSRPPPKFLDQMLGKIAGSGLAHAMGHGLIDQDNLILAGVGEALAKKARGWKDYYLATSADVGVTAFHRWLTERAGGHPAFEGGRSMAEPPHLTRPHVWDHYERHTKHCRQCQEAVSNIDGWVAGLMAAAVGCAGLAVLLSPTANVLVRGAPVLAGIACLALRQALTNLRQNFYSADHLPGEKP